MESPRKNDIIDKVFESFLNRQGNLMPTLNTVPVTRLERPTTQAFADYAAQRKPLVITGLADHWPALSKWTPDYLERQVGSNPIPVVTLPEGKPDGQFFYAGSQKMATVEFRQCLELLKGAPARHYMASVPIVDYLNPLYADIEMPAVVASKKATRACFWISGANSTGPLHYDLDENIHAVVTGRKHFLLYDYEQSPKLYPKSAFSRFPHMSEVDVAHPDDARFPRFREAQGYEATLDPGDMIYMPTGCWHRVTTLEPCIAVNFWFGRKYFRPSTLRIVLPMLLRLPVDLAVTAVRETLASKPPLPH
jgi:lysine-specific demethylase 8